MRSGVLRIAEEIQPDRACIGTARSGLRLMSSVWKRMISREAFCLSPAVYCGGRKNRRGNTESEFQTETVQKRISTQKEIGSRIKHATSNTFPSTHLPDAQEKLRRIAGKAFRHR